MVKKGFTGAFGAKLHAILDKGTGNRLTAFLSGIGVTALLQSSTATALLTTSFAQRGMITLTAALAIMIGADISTTLVAQILSFDLSWLAPAFIAIGVIGYKTSKKSSTRRRIFQIFMGLGFMLLSLSLIREASNPLKDSTLLSDILISLDKDPIFAILIAGIVTYIIHSSLAAILLFASLATAGVIDIHLGILLVLGANIGGAFVPFVASYKEGAIARQITTGNILMRGCMLLLCLPLITIITEYIQTLDVDNARHIVNFHSLFNVALAIIFMPLITFVAQICRKLFPYKEKQNKQTRPQYLEEHALESPAIALSGAAREALRIADLVEDMLEKTMSAFKQSKSALIKDIRKTEEDVDILYKATKLYLTRLSQEALDEDEAQRYVEILSFTTNLEHIGDIIDKSLLELAEKKIKHEYHFSDEGWTEIRNFHAKILGNMKLAQTVFMSKDKSLAAQLLNSKSEIRFDAEQTAEQHFKRLQGGNKKAMETSSLHLDIIRDYRRINSYATRVSYSVIDRDEDKED